MNKWEDIFKKLKEWEFEFAFIQDILKMDDAEEALYNKLKEVLEEFENGNVEEADIVLDLALLLGELKSERSLALFLKILSYKDDDIELLLGDMMFEVFPYTIMKTSEKQLERIFKFINNNDFDEYSRLSAIVAVIQVAIKKPERRETIIQNLRPLFANKSINTQLISYVFAYHLTELEEVAKKAFYEGSFDPMDLSEEELEYFDERCDFYDNIQDIYNCLYDLNKMHMHEKGLLDDLISPKGFGLYEGIENELFEVSEPRISFKIGRNEPCPCGSGKKYKKCCGK